MAILIEMTGNSSKNSTYLAMMKLRTLSPNHPRHMGIRMQAHHVLSSDGVKLSKLGPKLVKFGYDINTEKNLAFIPCTLQGACHLGVQPHIGNHTALGRPEAEASEDDYDDDAEPAHYHEQISTAVKMEAKKFPKRCKKGTKGNNSATDLLDALAVLLLERIQKQPAELPLTSVAEHFKRRSNIGCGGHDSVTILKDAPVKCAVERGHHGKQKIGQREEHIQYVSDGKYQLEMGK
jgi:hypothetical protein